MLACWLQQIPQPSYTYREDTLSVQHFHHCIVTENQGIKPRNTNVVLKGEHLGAPAVRLQDAGGRGRLILPAKHSEPFVNIGVKTTFKIHVRF